tara:strand:- start:997 stop:1149 length:153 start_codon:yes stop_codon:yes gene_type:complete
MKKWTQSDRQYLRDNYSKRTVAEIALHLETTENSVRKQVQYLRKRGWRFT